MNKYEYRAYIGKAIKAKRELLGMEQKELANKIGIDPANLCRIESGRYAVRLDTLHLILEELGGAICV